MLFEPIYCNIHYYAVAKSTLVYHKIPPLSPLPLQYPFYPLATLTLFPSHLPHLILKHTLPYSRERKKVAGAGFCWKNIKHRKKTQTKIKDGNNSTKIGATNKFRGNQLRFQISAQKVFKQLRYG